MIFLRRASCIILATPELLQVINFDQPDSGRSVRAANNRGVTAGTEGRDQSAFEGVAGREPRRLNLRGLQRILLPIVVRCKQISLAVVKFDHRIGQHVRKTEGSERWPNRADENVDWS